MRPLPPPVPVPPMPMLAAALTLLLAGPLSAAAQEPMTAEEFEAYSTGKTLSFAQGNVVWGTEQYLPGRRVVWAFSEEECQYGTWHQQGEQICFVYENDPAPQCWTFWLQGDGLRARFSGDPGGTELAEVGESTEPLACPGPDLGV